MHKGHEPDFETYPPGGWYDDDYKLGDHESDEGFIDEDRVSRRWMWSNQGLILMQMDLAIHFWKYVSMQMHFQ